MPETPGGWEAIDTRLRLMGWSRDRPVVVMRRPIPVNTLGRRKEPGRLPHLDEFATPDRCEYAAVGCSADLPLDCLPTLCAGRADGIAPGLGRTLQPLDLSTNFRGLPRFEQITLAAALGHQHGLRSRYALSLDHEEHTEAVRLDAEKRLLDGWTPEIISGRARLEGRALPRRA